MARNSRIDPSMIELPPAISIERLWLRAPRAGEGDGAALNGAVLQSLPELKPWLPCAQQAPIPEEERTCRQMALHARRVAIRMSADNLRSHALAERVSFALESVLRQDSRAADGRPRDTAVYSVIEIT